MKLRHADTHIQEITYERNPNAHIRVTIRYLRRAMMKFVRAYSNMDNHVGDQENTGEGQGKYVRDQASSSVVGKFSSKVV